MLAFLGVFAGVLSLAGNIPYVIDTLKGKTKPHRVTWGIYFLLNIIFLANQTAAGATSSLWLIISFTLSSLTIFLLSLKFGVGGTTKTDIIVLIGALSGVVIWQILDTPAASVIANVLVSLISSIPTFQKAYLQPASETKLKWILGSIAALFAAISVGALSFTLLLLPVYSFFYQGFIVGLLVVGAAHQNKNH